MRVKPDYFSWPVEALERYRVSMPERDAFRIRQVLLKAIFDVRIKTPEEFAVANEAFSGSERFLLNRALNHRSPCSDTKSACWTRTSTAPTCRS